MHTSGGAGGPEANQNSERGKQGDLMENRSDLSARAIPGTTSPESVAPHLSLARQKKDVDYVFFELTRSICPQCRRVIDAHILLRDNKVYMRKRCPEHGLFEGLVYGDAQAYTSAARFNKPGTIPLAYTTEIDRGCPHDCGLCPDHQQHACLGIIEVNSASNMDCPLCFANCAGYLGHPVRHLTEHSTTEYRWGLERDPQ